jgi:hypothetical protein
MLEISKRIVKSMTTPEHEPYDETAKEFFQRLFMNWGIEVETEREVFSRSRKIDLVVKCSDADYAQLQNTPFAHFRQLNSLELKGINDPLTVANYFRIMMRVWALGDQERERQKLANQEKTTDNKTDNNDEDDTSEPLMLANQLTVTIVCVTRPDSILRQLKNEYRFVKTKENGIYHCDEVLGKWIIYPSELDLVPKNYPLLSLAQGKKLDEFISHCLREGLIDYLQLIIDIGLATDPDVIWQKILEVSKVKYQIREETWPIIDQFFQQMPEAMGKLPTFKSALTAAQQQSLQQGKQIGEQQTLIRQLHRKFAQVPPGIVQHINGTSDLEQLDEWLDQIILAHELADIDFKVPQRESANQ